MIAGDGSSPDGAGDDSKARQSSDKCNSVAEKVDETKADDVEIKSEDSKTEEMKSDGAKGLELDTKEIVAPELTKEVTSNTKEKTSVEAT